MIEKKVWVGLVVHKSIRGFSLAAKDGDPKFSDIVFSLLIIYLWDLNKDI